MPPLPLSVSVQQLLASVRKLELQLRAVGLPRFLVRVPVCWLCWHYCRMLDNKIGRMRHVAAKFRKWLDTLRQMVAEGMARTELLDVDHSMRDDVESTKKTLWELRDYCIDIGRMFEQLGYTSANLRRKQSEFLLVVGTSYDTACKLQAELASHDNAVLALLRDMRARELANRVGVARQEVSREADSSG